MLRGENHMILNSATMRAVLGAGLNSEVFRFGREVRVLDVLIYEDDRGDEIVDDEGRRQYVVVVRRVADQPPAPASKPKRTRTPKKSEEPKP